MAKQNKKKTVFQILKQPSWISLEGKKLWKPVCEAMESAGVEVLPQHGWGVAVLCNDLSEYIRICGEIREATCQKDLKVLKDYQRDSWEGSLARSLESCCLQPHHLNRLEGFDVPEGFPALRIFDRKRKAKQ